MSKTRPDKLRYLFSKDQGQIRQFVDLRQTLYSSDEKLKGFRYFSHIETEDYNDPNMQMLLVLHRDRCVGGGCLTVSTPSNRVSLPLEEEFSATSKDSRFLHNLLPELDLEKKNYCEMSRIVLHPDYRDGTTVNTLFDYFLSAAKEQGCQYIFGIGDATRLRNNRHIFTQRFSLKAKIFFNIELPEKADFEGKRMYVMVVYCDKEELSL